MTSSCKIIEEMSLSLNFADILNLISLFRQISFTASVTALCVYCIMCGE